MYISKLYHEEDRNKILKFLRRNEFATLVTYDGSKPIASHLLMEIVEDGEQLLINGHMSRANPMWKEFDRDADVLVMFHGPHTYISPTWYNHVNVPTWNYQAVHAYGKPNIVTDMDEYRGMLSRLIARHEGGTPYRLETLPDDYVEKQMAGTVGFQIKVTRIEANYKLSQNRDEEDYHNIIGRLDERDDEMSHQVADAMRRQR